MLDFLINLDTGSFAFGMVFALVLGFIVSLVNLIDSRIELNYWMIRLTRARLGKKEPKPLWVRIKDRICKK